MLVLTRVRLCIDKENKNYLEVDTLYLNKIDLVREPTSNCFDHREAKDDVVIVLQNDPLTGKNEDMF